jgi:hypothetical protein
MAAPDVRLRNSRRQVRLRNARTVGLLDLFTLGIYGVYWYWATNRDLATLGSVRDEPALGDNPLRSFLALVPGYVLIVPAGISTLRTGRRVALAQRMAGIGEDELINPVAAMFLLMLLPPLGGWYVQRRLSAAWEVLAEAPEPALAGGTAAAR